MTQVVGVKELSDEEAKEAFGDNFSQVDVTDENPDKLKTETSEEGDLSLLSKRVPLAPSRKVKLSK